MNKRLWIEMSIREISTQAHFAELAYKNILKKAQTGDGIFSSLHSFLSHVAMISKMLKAHDDRNLTIQSILKITPNSVSLIHKRKFRNILEHYDKELKKWISKYEPDVWIYTYNIGPKEETNDRKSIYISHYDPLLNVATFLNVDVELLPIFNEVGLVKKTADKWIRRFSRKLAAQEYNK